MKNQSNDLDVNVLENSSENKKTEGPIFLQEHLFIPHQETKAMHLREVIKQEWKPQSEVEMQIKNEPWNEQNRYVVNLVLRFVVKNQNMTIFNLELTQSGVFRLENLDAEQQKFALNAAAPDSLFPYLRKGVADAMLNAGLPPMWLTPMSFAAMYQQQKQKELDAAKQESSSAILN